MSVPLLVLLIVAGVVGCSAPQAHMCPAAAGFAWKETDPATLMKKLETVMDRARNCPGAVA